MKIHVFGASGSGVTTLGNKLAEKLKISYFDSDDFFWIDTEIPFAERRDPEIRNQMISAELKNNKSWILGGSIIHWGENVFPEFDLIVFLYLPPEIRMERLKEREIQRYGEDVFLNPERKEKFNKFISWAADYDHATGLANRTLKAHKEWLSVKKKSQILEISGDVEVNEKMKLVLEKIRSNNKDQISI